MHRCAARRKEREGGATGGWGPCVGERGQRACGLRKGSACGRAVSGRWTRGAGRGARRAGPPDRWGRRGWCARSECVHARCWRVAAAGRYRWATQQELGSRVRSLSGERACWRALLVGRAERRGAGLGFPFPSLFYFPTTLKLFEFKFEFEFNPSTQTNKTMHQHECTHV